VIISRKVVLYIGALASYLCGFPASAQMTDPVRWLVQGRCGDGSPPDHCQFPGKTNTYYFTGPNCGGTGWIMFDVNVPKARWAGTLAMLGRSDDQQSCGKNYPAWTRTRRDDIAFPFIENEQPRLVTVETIVSDHYDDRDPNAARLMERFYYGYHWGWLSWERWEKTGTPPSDIPQRCPYVSLREYPSGGGENWRMVDCRMWTNILLENGDRTAQVGWP
jgi:hypothetical protein